MNGVGELARFVVDLSDTQFPDNSARSDSGNLNDSRFVSSAREVCHIRRLVVKTGGDFGCARNYSASQQQSEAGNKVLLGMVIFSFLCLDLLARDYSFALRRDGD